MHAALLDIPATQAILGGISRSTIYALCKSGELVPVKVRRRTLFSRDAVEALARTGA